MELDNIKTMMALDGRLEWRAVQDTTNARRTIDWLSHLSSSSLRVLAEAPELFSLKYIERMPNIATKQMEQGTVVHESTLSELLDQTWVRIPPEVLNADGHRKGAAWKAFESINAGKILLKDSEYATVEKIMQSLRRNQQAAMILGLDEHAPPWGRACEQKLCGEVIYTDEDGTKHAMPLLAFLDYYDPSWLADIKTSNSVDPQRFPGKAYEARYHLQAAFYWWLNYLHTGRDVPFYFVVAENKAPFRSRVFTVKRTTLVTGLSEICRGVIDFFERAIVHDWTTDGLDELLEL